MAFYRRIGLRAEADEDGGLAATWMFGQGALVCFGDQQPYIAHTNE